MSILHIPLPPNFGTTKLMGASEAMEDMNTWKRVGLLAPSDDMERDVVMRICRREAYVYVPLPLPEGWDLIKGVNIIFEAIEGNV